MIFSSNRLSPIFILEVLKNTPPLKYFSNLKKGYAFLILGTTLVLKT